MRVTLQEDLDQLEAALQEEGSLVLRALRGCLNALAQSDVELADEVIAFDDEIDEAYLGIEEGIQSLLARQTPVAVDLRLVLAMLHDNLHLERMADYCVTIAKLTKLVHDVPHDRTLIEGFEEMGARAEEMIRIALDSFRDRNAARAESLVDLDELIDRANRRVVQHVLSLGGDPDLREWGLRMIIVSRCLERIGDHAVDIGEQTAYLVSGEFREFTDASHGPRHDTARPVTPTPTVLFVCVHNAGRSQMAAALLDLYAAGRVHVLSAGSEPAAAIHPGVLEALAERGIDIFEAVPKRLDDDAVRQADVVVTMGCGDACPVYPGKRYEDWELPDPSGKSVEEVRPIRDDIDRRVRALLAELTAG